MAESTTNLDPVLFDVPRRTAHLLFEIWTSLGYECRLVHHPDTNATAFYLGSKTE